jgi:hypothetical protein
LSRLGSPKTVSRRVAVAKPKNDVYVALLAIALGAVLIAVVLLAMEMNSYEWSVTPKAAWRDAPAAFQTAARSDFDHYRPRPAADA